MSDLTDRILAWHNQRVAERQALRAQGIDPDAEPEYDPKPDAVRFLAALREYGVTVDPNADINDTGLRFTPHEDAGMGDELAYDDGTVRFTAGCFNASADEGYDFDGMFCALIEGAEMILRLLKPSALAVKAAE